ncbi:hypothetical protein L195_g051196, partial [Trifolium pratense]
GTYHPWPKHIFCVNKVCQYIFLILFNLTAKLSNVSSDIYFIPAIMVCCFNLLLHAEAEYRGLAHTTLSSCGSNLFFWTSRFPFTFQFSYVTMLVLFSSLTILCYMRVLSTLILTSTLYERRL